MSAVLEPVGEPTMLGTPNRFLVLWQHPETRTFHQIGLLSRSAHGYSFAYGPAVESIPGFAPLANFPNTARTYDSVDLFPVFANRVMTTRRDGYAQYVAALGLGPTPEPFEVLARTLGTRATDRIQVLPLPDPTPDGHIHLVFLVHGIRHVDPDGLQMAQLREGDTLHLAPEDDNPSTNARCSSVHTLPDPRDSPGLRAGRARGTRASLDEGGPEAAPSRGADQSARRSAAGLHAPPGTTRRRGGCPLRHRRRLGWPLTDRVGHSGVRPGARNRQHHRR